MTPTQVVPHDTRTSSAGSSNSKSFSFKTVRNIFSSSDHPYENLSKAKEEEVGNQANSKAYSEHVAVRKHDGYSLLETRHIVRKKDRAMIHGQGHVVSMELQKDSR